MKIGIDLGGTKTEGILLSSQGKELKRKRIKTEKNYKGTINGIVSIVKDFEDEFEQFLMNKKLAPKVEFIYLMSDLEWQFLSSGRVKEVAQLGGDVSDLVTPKVAEALQAKLQNSAHMKSFIEKSLLDSWDVARPLRGDTDSLRISGKKVALSKKT